MGPRGVHEEMLKWRTEVDPQCSHASRWRCQMLAFGSDEELQQSAMPSRLRVTCLEWLEQMQCRMWRWCDSAFA
eukprot:CAMPEP_0169214828 /NCGR_PEP_ID=MMETSP1016-20121227/17550_1 /TAXON_ID=342587 /ORGANISM="Karlodinium micrum, Strain CCMP2283" /LENGTH=73 /DNA_ID=CAMNT_0009292649 /DNA_START=20 /DNA_END=238 /DNA_ORIENTATION=+